MSRRSDPSDTTTTTTTPQKSSSSSSRSHQSYILGGNDRGAARLNDTTEVNNNHHLEQEEMSCLNDSVLERTLVDLDFAMEEGMRSGTTQLDDNTSKNSSSNRSSSRNGANNNHLHGTNYNNSTSTTQQYPSEATFQRIDLDQAMEEAMQAAAASFICDEADEEEKRRIKQTILKPCSSNDSIEIVPCPPTSGLNREQLLPISASNRKYDKEKEEIDKKQYEIKEKDVWNQLDDSSKRQQKVTSLRKDTTSKREFEQSTTNLDATASLSVLTDEELPAAIAPTLARHETSPGAYRTDPCGSFRLDRMAPSPTTSGGGSSSRYSGGARGGQRVDLDQSMELEMARQMLEYDSNRENDDDYDDYCCAYTSNTPNTTNTSISTLNNSWEQETTRRNRLHNLGFEEESAPTLISATLVDEDQVVRGSSNFNNSSRLHLSRSNLSSCNEDSNLSSCENNSNNNFVVAHATPVNIQQRKAIFCCVLLIAIVSSTILAVSLTLRALDVIGDGDDQLLADPDDLFFPRDKTPAITTSPTDNNLLVSSPSPTQVPSLSPTLFAAPSVSPSAVESTVPTVARTMTPTAAPTTTAEPTSQPTVTPTESSVLMSSTTMVSSSSSSSLSSSSQTDAPTTIIIPQDYRVATHAAVWGQVLVACQSSTAKAPLDLECGGGIIQLDQVIGGGGGSATCENFLTNPELTRSQLRCYLNDNATNTNTNNNNDVYNSMEVDDDVSSLGATVLFSCFGESDLQRAASAKVVKQDVVDCANDGISSGSTNPLLQLDGDSLMLQQVVDSSSNNNNITTTTTTTVNTNSPISVSNTTESSLPPMKKGASSYVSLGRFCRYEGSWILWSDIYLCNRGKKLLLSAFGELYNGPLPNFSKIFDLIGNRRRRSLLRNLQETRGMFDDLVNIDWEKVLATLDLQSYCYETMTCDCLPDDEDCICNVDIPSVLLSNEDPRSNCHGAPWNTPSMELRQSIVEDEFTIDKLVSNLVAQMNDAT